MNNEYPGRAKSSQWVFAGNWQTLLGIRPETRGVDSGMKDGK
jgi:hypothetical protein